MKKLLRKLKHANKALRYIYYFINIFYLVALIFFIISLLNLHGIETVIRIIIIVIFILYFIFYLGFNFNNLVKRKNTIVIATSIITLIFILIFCIASYYINVIYGNLDNLQESKNTTYTTYLITLKDTEFASSLKVGLISEEIELLDHTLGEKLYAKELLTNEIIDYSDYYTLISDLYDGEIEAIFVPGNYISLYSNEEAYEDIKYDTKVVFEYSETLANQDLRLASNKDFTEPLTFLLLGVDSTIDGLNANAAFNGDTLMLITINPTTLEAVMLSIPRDTFVPIACRNNAYAKINSSAAYGTDCVISTISNLLDIDIDYYVKINFKGVVELVDALGGIQVDVEKPYFNSYKGHNYNGQMCEQNSDRKFGDYLICVDPGLQTLNGEQALAYARNRHLYIGSDLDRIKHQQQIVEAIAKKALSFSSLADLEKILNAISNNIATNMETNTILTGYQMLKNIVGNVLSGDDAISINKATLETYSLSVYLPNARRKTSALAYYTDSLLDIQKALKVTLDEEKEEDIKTFSFSVNKEYTVYTPGKGIKTGKSAELLPNFVNKSVSVAEEFCKNNSIKLSIEYIDSTSTHYTLGISLGLISDQSVHESVLLGTVNELTIYVYNGKEVKVPTVEEEIPNEEENEKVTDEDIINDLILGEN